MGYGSRALSLLKQYYELKIPSIEEEQLPQEHIESVADENVGLLEERIGDFILTCSVCHICSPKISFYREVHVIAIVYNIQLLLYLQRVCTPKGILLFL
jgi:hypothetical protein